MSVETMLAIAKSLDMNLDYMMFGEISETEREWQQKDAMTLIHIIEKAPASQRNYAIRLLKLFIAATEFAYIDPFFFTTSGTQYLLCIQTYYYDCTKLRCKSP